MPDAPGGYSEEGFHRQRRNLLVGSIVLFFVHYADVRIGTQGSLFGIPITIGKPHAVHAFLYFGLLYWAWRFYPAHRDRKPDEMQQKAGDAMSRFFMRR